MTRKAKMKNFRYLSLEDLEHQLFLSQELFSMIIKQNPEQNLDKRIWMVSLLEKTTGLDFKSTKDMKSKMEKWLELAYEEYGKKLHKAAQKEYRETFSGCHLRILREQEGISQQTFASKFGVSQGYLANVESGRKALTGRLLDWTATNSAYLPIDEIPENA